MKPLYGTPEAVNHWFPICYIHHKEKLEMTESIYQFCLFFRSESLRIVEISTDDILILANKNFVSIEEESIKSAKIIIKDKEHLIYAYP